MANAPDESQAIVRRELGRLPDVCALGPRLLTMTGLFRQWMIDAFSDPENLEDFDLRHLVWDPDPKKGGITVESDKTWDPPATGSRPAVVVRRHAWRRIKLGINNNASYGMSLPDGTAAKANWWQGAHTLFCVGGTGGEAERLGTCVFREVNEFADLVRARFGGTLKSLEVVEVGEAGILKEGTGQTWVCPVTVAYVVEEAWRVFRTGTRLARVDVALLYG